MRSRVFPHCTGITAALMAVLQDVYKPCHAPEVHQQLPERFLLPLRTPMRGRRARCVCSRKVLAPQAQASSTLSAPVQTSFGATPSTSIVPLSSSSIGGNGRQYASTLNLEEYLVSLQNTSASGLGLVLAYCPITRQIVVQSIEEGSPAAHSKLIQVGDVLRMCSAVFGESMWAAVDLRRVRWAILHRCGKVKLLFQRRAPHAPLQPWYSMGCIGSTSIQGDDMQLPISLSGAQGTDVDQADSCTCAGRSLSVTFHRGLASSTQACKVQEETGLLARAARVQALCSDLSSVAGAADLNLGSYARASASSSSSTTPAGPGSSSSSGGNVGGDVKRVFELMPWLLISTGRLDTRDLSVIASARGLGSLLELGLNRSTGHLGVRGMTPAEAAAPAPGRFYANNVMPPAPFAPSGFPLSSVAPTFSSTTGALSSSSADLPVPTTTVTSSSIDSTDSTSRPQYDPTRLCLMHNAAAALQRLAFRRQGVLSHRPHSACNLLLQVGTLDGDVASLLAAWLHWYGRLPLQEAIQAVQERLQQPVDQGLVDAATDMLVEGASQRLNRLVLTWKHGGLSAYLAGDVVGSWVSHVPMQRCMRVRGCIGAAARGNFFLIVSGLRPGSYLFKYIVDGTWAVDPDAPKVLDSVGNWNNVLNVTDEPPPVIPSSDRLLVARWQAAMLALEAKMGLPSPYVS